MKVCLLTFARPRLHLNINSSTESKVNHILKMIQVLGLAGALHSNMWLLKPC